MCSPDGYHDPKCSDFFIKPPPLTLVGYPATTVLWPSQCVLSRTERVEWGWKYPAVAEYPS